MSKLSEKKMREFLRRILALQKQNAFAVEAFTVTPYHFKDTDIMSISCWVNRHDDDSQSFGIDDYRSIEDNERTMNNLEAYLNAI